MSYEAAMKGFQYMFFFFFPNKNGDNMKYLIKRCGHQELGSMDATMRPQRGQYLLMSMNPEVLSFFPPLSKTQINDYRLIPIYPAYANSKVYCRFVYHNDKYHGSTAAHPRNEYRLYLNREVQGGTLRFYEDGIVVMRLVKEGSFDDGMLLDYVSASDGELYKTYNNALKSSAVDPAANYGCYSGVLSAFEERFAAKSELPIDVEVADADVEYIEKNKATEESLFNEVSFRDFLMVGYQGKCAITRTVIAKGGIVNLEAAHIQPKAHGGTFLPSNGMMLCRDFHWAFDHGFLALTDDFHVIVSSKTNSDMLNPYNGKQIFVPENPFFRPNVESIRWHRQHVFEHFATIRAM